MGEDEQPSVVWDYVIPLVSVVALVVGGYYAASAFATCVTRVSIEAESSSTVTAAPEATLSVPAPPAPIPAPQWQVVEDLGAVKGTWGALSLKARVDGGVWRIPYPWHLTTPNHDCGVFPTLHEGAWRSAFCVAGGVRTPVKLTLKTRESALLVQIDDEAEVYVK